MIACGNEGKYDRLLELDKVRSLLSMRGNAIAFWEETKCDRLWGLEEV